MKYDIRFTYDDKYTAQPEGSNDFQLTVRATFDDQAAPLVAETLTFFYEKYQAEKDLAQRKAEEIKDKK